MSGEKPPEWLPDGWIMELRTTRSGSKYRCYIDPFTGSKFYSGKDALRHLKDGKLHSPKPSLKRSLNTNMDNVISQVELSPDGLPRGWVKETKFRKSGIYKSGVRKDPYYIDPVTGYVFRSLKDTVHYINTGEISKHAFLPKNRDNSNTFSSDMEASVPNSDEEMAVPVDELPERPQSPSPQDASTQCEDVAVSVCTTQPNAKQVRKTRKGSKKVVQSVTGELPEAVKPLEGEKKKGIKDLDPTVEDPPINRTPPEPSKDKQLELVHITPKSVAKSSKRSKKRKSEVELLLENQTNIKDMNSLGRENSKPSMPDGERLKIKLEPAAAVNSLVLEDSHSLSVNHESTEEAAKYRSSQAKTQIAIGSSRRLSKRLAMLKTNQEPDVLTCDIPQQVIPSPAKDSNSNCNSCKEVKEAPQTDPVPRKQEPECMEQPADRKENSELEKLFEANPGSPVTLSLGDLWADPCFEFAFRTLTSDLPDFDDCMAIQGYFQNQLVSPQSSRPSSLDSSTPEAQDGLSKSMPAVQTKPQKDEKPSSEKVIKESSQSTRLDK
ncbi:hypothetical protein J5N97_023634 [Dioscorea zingiberensis]|uniref:MBD domain-containing protein n=1 Tax=Dioscorea zingiberensis TaxID=325984 RepID=A0A9D5C653_9LILI|nr:hypothetical protein J5N97_023634 [Dioscorea zingiberensis]